MQFKTLRGVESLRRWQGYLSAAVPAARPSRRRLRVLWMIERTPSGNAVATTVFPMYAEGTDEFVVLETRHTTTGIIVLGQDTYGL
jgi:hypothetical protein